MKIKVLMAQRKERYPGEYDLEALAVMTEADEDANPDYLPDTLESNRSTGEFDALSIVTLEVDRNAIMSILYPAAAPVPATVAAG